MSLRPTDELRAHWDAFAACFARAFEPVTLQLCLSLSEALRYVNRSVFDGETVRIPAPSPAAAAACVAALGVLRTGASVRARTEED